MPFDSDDIAQVNSDIDWLHKHPDKVPGPIAQIGERYRRLRNAHQATSDQLVALQQENASLKADNKALRDRLELPPARAPAVSLQDVTKLAAEGIAAAAPAARSGDVRREQVEADADE